MGATETKSSAAPQGSLGCGVTVLIERFVLPPAQQNGLPYSDKARCKSRANTYWSKQTNKQTSKQTYRQTQKAPKQTHVWQASNTASDVCETKRIPTNWTTQLPAACLVGAMLQRTPLKLNELQKVDTSPRGCKLVCLGSH